MIKDCICEIKNVAQTFATFTITFSEDSYRSMFLNAALSISKTSSKLNYAVNGLAF